MKVNYQIEMERELARIAESGRRPRLFAALLLRTLFQLCAGAPQFYL